MSMKHLKIIEASTAMNALFRNSLAFTIALISFMACQEISQEEFRQRFQELSQNRLKFRVRMKSLGDSSYAHQEYSRYLLAEMAQNAAFEAQLEPGYRAYNDSLRGELENAQHFFAQHWRESKPVVSKWEQLDMRFDEIMESLKKGDISEKNGLDSLNAYLAKMTSYQSLADTLLAQSNNRYWQMRKTWDEYQYNIRNLKALYLKKNR